MSENPKSCQNDRRPGRAGEHPARPPLLSHPIPYIGSEFNFLNYLFSHKSILYYDCLTPVICFEDYRPSVQANCYLVFTDCNSLDLYAFTQTTIDKFITIALGGLSLSVADLTDLLNSILQRVYAVRLANELLGWGMEWIPFTNYVKVRKRIILFDEERFVHAYLLKNNRSQEQARFKDKIREVEKLLSQDQGRRIRGHDLSDLLLLVIRNMRKDRKFGNSETLEGSLMASLECRDLERSPFFRRILAISARS